MPRKPDLEPIVDRGPWLVIVAILFVLIAVSWSRLHMRAEQPPATPKRCVVTPLRGGGMVTWCEPEAERHA